MKKINHKVHNIISILTVFLWVTMLIIYPANVSAQPKTYVSSDRIFTINYPDDWKINKLETSGEISLNATGANLFKTCLVKMEITPLIAGYEKSDIHELAEAETKMLKGQNGTLSLEILESSFKNIKDHEWWIIKGKLTRKKEVYFTNSYKTIHNGKTYVLTYFSIENLFEKNATAAYQILESIDFLTKLETTNNTPKESTGITTTSGTLEKETVTTSANNTPVKKEPVTTADAKAATKNKLSFAIPTNFVFNEACLIGKQAAGVSLVIVDQIEDKIFAAKTGVYKTLQDDMSNKFGVTTLTKKIPDGFYPLIAIINPGEGKYQSIAAENINDKAEISRLNKLITDSNSIVNKFKTVVVPANDKAYVNDLLKETLAASKSETLKAVKYQMNGISNYLVEYDEKTQFLIVNNKTYSLPGGTQHYGIIKAFSMGADYYIYFSDSPTVAKCNHVIACAFKIEESGATKVFESCY